MPRKMLLGMSLLRPSQWTKNILVILPLFFCDRTVGSFDTQSSVLYWTAALGFVCFCLWSSAVYVFNDLMDYPIDRQHPRKKNRPIASGRIPRSVAAVLAVVLAAVPFIVCGWMLWRCPGVNIIPYDGAQSGLLWFITAGVCYLINNLLYNLLLRRVPVLDILSISTGFLLRFLGGTWLIGAIANPWAVATVFALTLMMGLGKRRMEKDVVQRNTGSDGYRTTLNRYPVSLLNFLMTAAGVATFVCYFQYTIDPAAILFLQTTGMVYTLPFTAFGITRFLELALSGRFDGPDEVFFHDRWFAVNWICWIITVIWVL